MKIIPFTGNVEAYIEEMQKCKIMVCTRFHSMVFALMLEKPFVPIIYEEKMKRIFSFLLMAAFLLSGCTRQTESAEQWSEPATVATFAALPGTTAAETEEAMEYPDNSQEIHQAAAVKNRQRRYWSKLFHLEVRFLKGHQSFRHNRAADDSHACGNES